MGSREVLPLEPLRVRAWLRAPVVSDRWLPLDGMLLYQEHRDRCGQQNYTLPGEYSAKSVGMLSCLGMAGPGGREWFYRCSWAQWSAYAEGQDHWNKRFDASLASLIDFDGRRGRVDTKAGTYKAYHMPVFYRAALWVEWYCMGNRRRIAELLSTLTHIGKKREMGWGCVARWEIEPAARDYSVVKDGVLMRGVPAVCAPEGIPYTRGRYAVRPSYWNPSNQMDLNLPV